MSVFANKYSANLHYLYKAAIDILFPPKCLSCEVMINNDDAGLCPACWLKIDFISEPRCAICSYPFEYSHTGDELCLGCLAEKPLYHKLYFVFKYHESSKILLHKFKYGDRTYIGKYLVKWMLRSINAEILREIDVVVPVPMHRYRLWRRMYNQSALLARQLAVAIGCNFEPRCLNKVRHTTSQSGLTRAQRKSNIHGAFATDANFNSSIVGKTVLLVDDVFTTGATVHACTKQLLKAGCAKVIVATVARRLK